MCLTSSSSLGLMAIDYIFVGIEKPLGYFPCHYHQTYNANISENWAKLSKLHVCGEDAWEAEALFLKKCDFGDIAWDWIGYINWESLCEQGEVSKSGEIPWV